MGVDSIEREVGQGAARLKGASRWLPRQVPLRPLALIADEPNSLIVSLIDALLKLPAQDLARMRAWRLEQTGGLVILGEERLLPTPSDAIYLGVDPQHPGVLMPCFLQLQGDALTDASWPRDPLAWQLILPDPEHTIRQIKLGAGAAPLTAQTLEAARHARQ